MLTDSDILKDCCDGNCGRTHAMFMCTNACVRFFIFARNNDMMFSSLDHFYNTLCEWIKGSRNKVVFGNRYVGTIIDVDRSAFYAKPPYILIDGYIEFASDKDAFDAKKDLQQNYNDNLYLFNDGDTEVCFGVM